ncbi:MAG: TrkH family potassium uptake protein [Pseudomarimonas sp.]
MRWRAIIKVLGVIIGLMSLTKLPSLLVALALNEPTIAVFAGSACFTGLVGLALWWPCRHSSYQMRLRDGFLIVTLTWVAASLVSSLPLMAGPPYLSFADAVFEATSGLTTTGATVISGLDGLPKSMLLYRQVLQFFGGMGIVILAVAILPMLKIGGTQLFRAETTGPSRDSKLTPRIGETAKALWLVYSGLTAMCALAFWVAGMSIFDAICHALSTVSTGGFSTHDAALGHWDSQLVDLVAIVFMILGGINFSLHFVAWRNASVNHYFQDSELRGFLGILGGVSLLVALILWWGQDYPSISQSLRFAALMVVSIMTTTGFAVSGFDGWTGIAPMLLMIVAVIGGCSGSTVGGLKVARVIMVLRHGLREVRQLVHPKGQFLVKMGGKRVSESVVLSVSGFITLWLVCGVLLWLGFISAGLDMQSAFGAMVATLANAGPGLGEVAYTFSTVGDAAVWLGTLGMLLGRLEVFSILVLLTPTFWRE